MGRGRPAPRPGPLGVQVNCPCCGDKCRVRTSKQITPSYREVLLVCCNLRCGWRGSGHVACDSTITPSLTGTPLSKPPMPSEVGSVIIREWFSADQDGEPKCKTNT